MRGDYPSCGARYGNFCEIAREPVTVHARVCVANAPSVGQDALYVPSYHAKHAAKLVKAWAGIALRGEEVDRGKAFSLPLLPGRPSDASNASRS